jgi:hypothetical protein
MTKAINETTMLQLMEDILLVLHKHGADEMVNFYVNGTHFSTDRNTDFIEHVITDNRTNECVSYYEDIKSCDVTKQIEYSNPKTITMTFEGPLYHDINYGSGKILKQMETKAKKYGLYSELGYAWSLAFYEE